MIYVLVLGVVAVGLTHVFKKSRSNFVLTMYIDCKQQALVALLFIISLGIWVYVFTIWNIIEQQPNFTKILQYDVHLATNDRISNEEMAKVNAHTNKQKAVIQKYPYIHGIWRDNKTQSNTLASENAQVNKVSHNGHKQNNVSDESGQGYTGLSDMELSATFMESVLGMREKSDVLSVVGTAQSENVKSETGVHYLPQGNQTTQKPTVTVTSDPMTVRTTRTSIRTASEHSLTKGTVFWKNATSHRNVPQENINSKNFSLQGKVLQPMNHNANAPKVPESNNTKLNKAQDMFTHKQNTKRDLNKAQDMYIHKKNTDRDLNNAQDMNTHMENTDRDFNKRQDMNTHMENTDIDLNKMQDMNSHMKNTDRDLNKAQDMNTYMENTDRDETIEDRCKNTYTQQCGPSELYNNLNYALRSRASNTRVILIVGSIDEGMRDFALNFFTTSIARHSICNILFISIVDSVLDLVSTYGMPIYRYNESIKHMEQGDFKSKAFKEKSLVKLKITHKALKLGYTVLINDLDMFYKVNPFVYINKTDRYDMVVQNNTEDSGLVVNTGFMYIKPTLKTLTFFNILMDTLNQWSSDIDDQSLFNYVLRQNAVAGLSIAAFPVQEVCVGRAASPRSCLVYHANFIRSLKMKVLILKDFGMWYTDLSSVRCQFNQPVFIEDDDIF